MADPVEREALLAQGEPFVPPYVGAKGWIGIRLDRSRTDWEEVRELIATGYCLIASKRLAEKVTSPPSLDLDERLWLLAPCDTPLSVAVNNPHPAHTRWTSVVADCEDGTSRILHEQGNASHRLRVEHNRETLLVHLSHEDGQGWTVVGVDRATRRWVVAQAPRQLDAAGDAYSRLYSDTEAASSGRPSSADQRDDQVALPNPPPLRPGRRH